MTIGIYSIYFENIDKIYIGQSQCIEHRFIAHKSIFKRGHYNYKLAQAYKLDVPIYSILEICIIDCLNNLEISYIKEFNSVANGLNIQPGGDAGIPGYYSTRCTNTREELETAFNLLADPSFSKLDILKASSISSSVLDNIISGKRHIWLHEYYPDISKKVLNNKHVRASNAQENRYKTDCILISPDNIEYICTNRNKFAKEHNLNSGHLGAVIRQQETQHKWWKLKKGVQQYE